MESFSHTTEGAASCPPGPSLLLRQGLSIGHPYSTCSHPVCLLPNFSIFSWQKSRGARISAIQVQLERHLSLSSSSQRAPEQALTTQCRFPAPTPSAHCPHLSGDQPLKGTWYSICWMLVCPHALPHSSLLALVNTVQLSHRLSLRAPLPLCLHMLTSPFCPPASPRESSLLPVMTLVTPNRHPQPLCGPISSCPGHLHLDVLQALKPQSLKLDRPDALHFRSTRLTSVDGILITQSKPQGRILTPPSPSVHHQWSLSPSDCTRLALACFTSVLQLSRSSLPWPPTLPSASSPSWPSHISSCPVSLPGLHSSFVKKN